MIIVLIYRFLPGFFSRISDASVFQLTTPFHFGVPTFEIGAIVSMFIVMLVIMTETTADMLATTFAGFFNGFSVSASAQNVGLVAITGIKSRFVVATRGVILLLLGLFPILGAFIALVPLPVLVGAGLALFGTGAASGIRTLAQVEYDGNANLVIVALWLGTGIIPISVPEFYEEFPEWFQVIFDSGTIAAAITAVLLNIIFNIIGRTDGAEGPIFSEGNAPTAISDEDEARLQRPKKSKD